jgi:hypothetical protein
MAKKQQIKQATRRVRTATKPKRTSFWKRVWNIVCWPFRMIWRACKWVWKQICRVCKWVWNWLCKINLVGLVNLTLLVAIIALFTMLIIDVVGCRRNQVVVINQNDVVETVVPVKAANKKVVQRPVKPVTNVLPLKKDSANEMVNEPINVAQVQVNPVTEKQTAKVNNTMYGDVVIDSRGAGKMISHNTNVRGNLYLQNMRKYVLPCGVRIDGNLFLRDVNMLQFCGKFVVTGNIYVSPRSSFGPIPGTAKVGGQIIL